MEEQDLLDAGWVQKAPDAWFDANPPPDRLVQVPGVVGRDRKPVFQTVGAAAPWTYTLKQALALEESREAAGARKAG